MNSRLIRLFRERLAFRLPVLITLLVSLPLIVLFVVSRGVIANEIYASQEDQFRSQALTQVATIQAVYDRAVDQARSNVAFARYVLDQTGMVELDTANLSDYEAVNQNTGEKVRVSIPQLKVGGRPLAFDYRMVDTVQQRINCMATIFQLIPQGMLRVSTNVRT